MSSIGRKIKYLRMHQTFLIEKFGNVSNPLNTLEKKNGRSISGTVVDFGILLEADLEGGGKSETLMPWGNVVQVELLPQDSNVLKLKK